MKVPYQMLDLVTESYCWTVNPSWVVQSNHWLESTKTPRKSPAVVNIFVTSLIAMKLPYRTQTLKAMKDLV
jgi:hypothetical protein